MNRKHSSKTFVFDSDDNSMEIREILIPKLGDGELLVKNEYVTLCRSDINTYIGKRKEKNPTILGHEIVGRIAEMNESSPQNDLCNQQLKVGDRITWGIYSSNPGSGLALCGIPQKGDELFKYGHEELTEENTLHGGLSEFTIIRKNTPIIKLNCDIPLKVSATINCSIATVSGAFRLAGSVKGKKILIIGVGMLGIVACSIAKSNQAQLIVSSDINTSRLNESKLFGADLALDFSTIKHEEFSVSLEKFDVIFDFSGIPEAMELSLKLLSIGGTTVWVGATFPQREVKLSAEKLIRNIHTVKGLHNYNQDDFKYAVKFLEENYRKYPFEILVEDLFSLNETKDAFKYAIDQNSYRVGIEIK